jgi:hypothetical protein
MLTGTAAGTGIDGQVKPGCEDVGMIPALVAARIPPDCYAARRVAPLA